MIIVTVKVTDGIVLAADSASTIGKPNVAAEDYSSNFYSPTAEAGNYNAQRQLGYRLADDGRWRITSPIDRDSEERDFQIAMNRRREPEGASLAEMGAKFGL